MIVAAGFSGMALCLTLLTIALHWQLDVYIALLVRLLRCAVHESVHSEISQLSFGFVASFAISAGPVPWILLAGHSRLALFLPIVFCSDCCAECFPTEYEGAAGGLGASLNWSCVCPVLLTCTPISLCGTGLPTLVWACSSLPCCTTCRHVLFVAFLSYKLHRASTGVGLCSFHHCKPDFPSIHVSPSARNKR